MATPALKTPLVAADTNVLLDLAFKDDGIWQCLETLKARRPAPRFIVTPTVLQELAHLFVPGNTQEKRAAATHREASEALGTIRSGISIMTFM